jgi:peptidyl-prolyl cis-trans isomerase-like 1
MARVFLTFVLALACVLPLDAQKQKKKVKMKPIPKTYAMLTTSMGAIEIELFEKAAPKTVKNFIGLAGEGYYNGVLFHRVIDNFMIQTGDSTGTGRGGRSIYGAPFEDEFVDTLRHDAAGTVSMANRGPNTNESQFFITLVPTPWLNGKHTIFGKVVSGMDVVRAIGKVKTLKPFDRPVEPVILKSVTIVRK